MLYAFPVHSVSSGKGELCYKLSGGLLVIPRVSAKCNMEKADNFLISVLGFSVKTPGKIAALAIILLLAPYIYACSVVRGYIRPTNYELIKTAHCIVLAQAMSFANRADGGDASREIQYGLFTFKVLERLKGLLRMTRSQWKETRTGDRGATRTTSAIPSLTTGPAIQPTTRSDPAMYCYYALSKARGA